MLIARGETCVQRRVSDKLAPLEAAAQRQARRRISRYWTETEGRANVRASGRSRASPEAKTVAALSAEPTSARPPDFRNPLVKAGIGNNALGSDLYETLVGSVA